MEKGRSTSHDIQEQKIDDRVIEFCKCKQKLNLLENIMDFNHDEYKIGLSEKLQKEGWFHITSKAFEEFLNIGDDTYEIIGKHRVYTTTYSESRERAADDKEL